MGAKKKHKLFMWSTLVVLLLVWLALPVIAGMFKIGDIDGPRIYPVKLHEALYKMGYGAAGHGTAHESFFNSLIYERPWFYGMKRKPIPQAKAEEIVNGTKHWMNEKYHSVMGK